MDALLSRLSIEELCPACRLDRLTLERLPDRPSAPDICGLPPGLGVWMSRATAHSQYQLVHLSTEAEAELVNYTISSPTTPQPPSSGNHTALKQCCVRLETCSNHESLNNIMCHLYTSQFSNYTMVQRVTQCPMVQSSHNESRHVTKYDTHCTDTQIAPNMSTPSRTRHSCSTGVLQCWFILHR